MSNEQILTSSITIRIDKVAIASERVLGIILSKRAAEVDEIVTEHMSYQRQGFWSKLFGRKWLPPTREEMTKLLDGFSYDMAWARNRYAVTEKVASALLKATRSAMGTTMTISIADHEHLSKQLDEIAPMFDSIP